MFDFQEIVKVDPEIAELIEKEEERQQDRVELIASENFVSKAVMAAMGSVLTNKYAEGYPGKRYYGGCENVDQVETLAIERVKALFGAKYANVQPHSGSQANFAVYQWTTSCPRRTIHTPSADSPPIGDGSFHMSRTLSSANVMPVQETPRLSVVGDRSVNAPGDASCE